MRSERRRSKIPFDAVVFAHRRRTFEDAGHVTCPSCGYPTILERGTFEICPLCQWEDDGQDDAEYRPPSSSVAPDVIVGGANHDYSLTEARANFANNVTSYRPADRDFEIERARTGIKRKIVDAYERAVRGLVGPDRAIEDARYFFTQLDGF